MNTEPPVSDIRVPAHDDPIDVIGGEGEFAVVGQAGLPVTLPANQEEEDNENPQDNGNLEIPSISKQVSVVESEPGRTSGMKTVHSNSLRRHSAIPRQKHGLQGLSDKKKHFLGVFLIMLHCLMIIGSSQLAKLTYAKDFSAPFFLVYFRSLWRIFVFPIFMVVKYFHRRRRHYNEGAVSFMKTYTSSVLVLGPEGFTWKNFIYPCGLLSLFWIVVQFAHVFAIKFLNISVAQALFCSETAFCYLLSAIFLKVPVYVIKVVAVLIALCGTGLISYSQAGDDLRWEGIAICLSGALLGSAYMIVVKKTVGRSDDIGQILLLTSAMSVFVVLTCWPMVIALYYSGFEYWDLETVPWGAICGSSALMLVTTCLFNISLTLTNPLLMTLSKLMGIPVSYGIDAVFWNHKFDIYQIIGVFFIGVGFVFIALPENWLAIDNLKRKILRRRTSSSPTLAISVTSVAGKGAGDKQQ